MNTDDMSELVRRAVDSVRERPAARRRANASYALTVKAGYEEILGLRDDGYSYDLICEVFAENGLLPEHANPKTLCSAFLREKRRREKKVLPFGTARKEATSDPSKAEPVKPNFATDMTKKKEIKASTFAEETTLVKFTYDEKKIPAMSARTGENSPGKAAVKKEESVDAMEKERVRKMTGFSEETALGKITRHSDGSFDFDWN
jgi:hypothetical protein